MPVGRTALWWCLGLGLGMVVGELFHLLRHGQIMLPTAATGSPLLTHVLTLWPWGLAAAAGALLLVGMRPVTRIEVDRKTAAHLCRTGTSVIAKVLRASTPRPGPRAAVDASLLLRSPAGFIYSSDVHWTLDPVDAGRLRSGTVVPVRIDPRAPHVAALDTLADSRSRLDGIDADAAFSARRRAAQLAHRLRGWSRIAVLTGIAARLLIVLV